MNISQEERDYSHLKLVLITYDWWSEIPLWNIVVSYALGHLRIIKQYFWNLMYKMHFYIASMVLTMQAI